MQQKNLLILSLVTVVALVVATLTLRDGDGAVDGAGRARLFPELSARLNDVAQVRLQKGEQSVTLEKQGGQWKLADRGGYPAQFEKVKELAVRIADLEIEEAKTAKKSNHAQLAVEWPNTAEEGSEAAEAALVTLADASGKELAALVVGKSEWRGSKTKVYARRANEDQVYLCSPRGTLEVVPEPKGWIEPKFLELANERVQDVTIEHADGERVEIGRSAENHTQFKVKNLAPGQSERYEGVANGVAQAIGYGLQLEDVRPASEVDFSLEPVAKTRFRCVDGLELLLETAKVDDKTWLKVSASYTPPPEPSQPAAPADDAVAASDGEASAEVTPEPPTPHTPDIPDIADKKDVAKEAAELNERLAPWAFAVGSYKTDVLARRMKDLLPEPAPMIEDGGLQGVMEQLGMDPFEQPGDAPPLEAPPENGAEDPQDPEPEEPIEEVEPERSPDDEPAAPPGGEPKPE